MKELPKGSLRCARNKGTSQFYLNGKYAGKEQRDTVKKVAQRDYYEKLKPVIKKRLHILHKIEFNYESQEMERCFMNLCEARKKLISPIFETVEEKIKKFMEEKYEPGNFLDENETQFFTLKGERVRSKSEVLISEHLNYYGIPYRYERPIELRDWNKTVICRPDFTVMNKRTGKIYLYEHLGKMDDADYVDANMRKLELYEKNGYLLGDRLIITHETSKSPLNVKVLDSYIMTYFV